MAAKSEPVQASEDRVLVLTRVFDAPRSLVFKAWTDPKHAVVWSGPRGFTVPHYEMDMRPGGSYRICLRDAGGVEHWQTGINREIVENERLVFTFAWEDAQGKPGHETLVTVTFAEREGKTTLTLHQAQFKSRESRDGHRDGWSQSLDRLGEYLPNLQDNPADREIVITRVFDAPRELAFEAWTNPKHVPLWWGPRGFTTTVHEMEIKPGGVWRFIMHGPDGTDYPNKITFLEIVRPQRIIFKQGGSADGEPVNFQNTVTFEDEAGKTKLTMRMIFPSAAARNFVVEKYGAIEGGKQHLERLGEYVAKMAPTAMASGRACGIPID